MLRYDQVCVVENNHIRQVNGKTRIYTIEFSEREYVSLFDVPGVLFDRTTGRVSRCSPVDRFPFDWKEKLTENSVIRTNVNWDNNPRLIYACALINKDLYSKEVINEESTI
jgi:hypothetical protein